MLSYVGLTIWVFVILLLGLRPDAIIVADCWPNLPNNAVARRNKRIVTGFVILTFLLFWVLTAFRAPQIGNDTNTYLYSTIDSNKENKGNLIQNKYMIQTNNRDKNNTINKKNIATN